MIENSRATKPSFLGRLRNDTTGNTLAMAAIALFPIIGLVGGGVDIGRGYMAKARLQQACDAGALAARRNMTKDTIQPEDIAEAKRFFNFNFPAGSFGTDPFVEINGKANPLFTDGVEARTVDGKVETKIPTTLMRVFGKDTMTIKADCTTRLDVGNVDVMMVLDLSGSMDWDKNGKSGKPVADRRITGLRNAVKEFYGVLGPGGGGTSVTNQIRYGFVNYNSNVNVGKLLYDANPNWLIGGVQSPSSPSDNAWKYQSRRAVYEVTQLNSNNMITEEYTEALTYNGEEAYTQADECNKFANNKKTDARYIKNRETENTDPFTYVPSSQTNPMTVGNTTYTYSFKSWASPDIPFDKNANNWKTCKRNVIKKTPDETKYDTYDANAADGDPNKTIKFKEWEYGNFYFDVSKYVASISTGTPALDPSRRDGDTDRWSGCIEERDTVSTITNTSTSIPSGALDLDIDTLPTDEASRWRPFWENLVYKSSSDGDYVEYSTCPTASRRLAQYDDYDTASGVDTSDNIIGGSMKAYIDSLDPTGNTNHTIGMIWGARLLSPSGLFATENKKVGNSFPIARHLIFMTDGEMNFNGDRYNVYGYNKEDGRIAPKNTSNGDLDKIQTNRFKLMCQAIRNKGITIWVVQFGVDTVSDDMKACASGPDYAAPANSNDSLKTAFSSIAKSIGGLRVAK